MISCSKPESSLGYRLNAFSITNQEGELILSNRDLKCVSLQKDKEEKNSALFTLNDIAARFFYEFTKKNIGKVISISICGQPEEKPKILQPISKGQIYINDINDFQIQCLKRSFKVNTPCPECPICKNE